MDEIHFAPPKKPWLKPLFVGIYVGNQTIPGLLGCELDFVAVRFGDQLQSPGASGAGAGLGGFSAEAAPGAHLEERKRAAQREESHLRRERERARWGRGEDGGGLAVGGGQWWG